MEGSLFQSTSNSTAENCLSSPYHLRGSAVLIHVIEVTLSIMGPDEASQPAIQSEVRHVVCGKHQQVVGLLSPTYLLLFTWCSKSASIKSYFNYYVYTKL